MLTHNERLLIARLVANRESLVATIGQIDVMLLERGVDPDTLQGATAAACEHPAEDVVNHHMTLDDNPDDYECTRCGARQSEPFHPE